MPLGDLQMRLSSSRWRWIRLRISRLGVKLLLVCRTRYAHTGAVTAGRAVATAEHGRAMVKAGEPAIAPLLAGSSSTPPPRHASELQRRTSGCPVTGEMLEWVSHSMRAGRSNVWPSAAMTGSRISRIERKQR